MNARLANTNTVVPQQKSPIIVVVRGDIKDGEQKKIYIKNDPHEENSDVSEEESESSPLHQAQVSYYENKDNDVSNSSLIWSHRKPTESDAHATEYFLQMRGSDKYRSLFADKKYGKYKLWSEIAEEMNNAGYYVGEGREAAERCRQKFSNLEKTFLKYVKNMRSGSHRKEPPPFYDLMCNLVDSDDKLYRQEQHALIDAVRDTLQVELVAATSKDSTIPSSSKNNENSHPEFSNTIFTTEKIKKSKSKNDVISLLTKQHVEMMKLQRDFLEKIDKHLTVQNEQRERMVTSFIEAMKENKDNSCSCQRKRKRSPSVETELPQSASRD